MRWECCDWCKSCKSCSCNDSVTLQCLVSVDLQHPVFISCLWSINSLSNKHIKPDEIFHCVVYECYHTPFTSKRDGSLQNERMI